MADEADSPAALNRDLRAWVHNWTDNGIGQIASSVNTSKSNLYAATANSNLIPRRLLLAIVRAAVPINYDTGKRTEWIDRWTSEWERRWEAAEAWSRGERAPHQQPEPALTAALEPPDHPNTVVRLAPDTVLPALSTITDPAVREITSHHVYLVRDPVLVGYHDRVPISVYLDLHSASCDSHNRDRLARFLASRVRGALGNFDPDRTFIATPREGNTLIGSRVAELCGVDFLMVRTTDPPPRFGFPVEGTYPEEAEAVIVDDLVMGTLVPRTATLLRAHAGMTVKRCVSIFERADLDVAHRLNEASVLLDAAFKIDHELLAGVRRLFDQQREDGNGSLAGPGRSQP